MCNEGLGECVPVSLCSNKTKFNDGRVIIQLNIRFLEEYCHYLEVCCDPENIISSNEGRLSITRTINQHSVDTCMEQCKKPSADYNQKLPPKVYMETQAPVSQFCGYRNQHGIGFEFTQNSQVSQFGEFPWMVALTENNKYICGGSLIHPHVVLTAAHCVYDKQAVNLMARLGEWDTKTENEPFLHSDYEIRDIRVVTGFQSETLVNDVALLVLKYEVKLSAHINTVCLPPKNFKFDSAECFASGWGADEYAKKGSYRANLKKMKLPTVPLKDCQDRLRSTRLGPLFKLNLSFMCAGGEMGIDMCAGKLFISETNLPFTIFLQQGTVDLHWSVQSQAKMDITIKLVLFHGESIVECKTFLGFILMLRNSKSGLMIRWTNWAMEWTITHRVKAVTDKL